MTEYCTPDDVRKRLTTAGYHFAADLDKSGSVSTAETGDTITPAIEYAGNLIDACALRAGCHIDDARAAANAWFRDRAIDIAAYRVSTTGGRGTIACLKDDHDSAKKKLDEITKVPGLTFSYGQNSYISSRFPKAMNVRRR